MPEPKGARRGEPIPTHRVSAVIKAGNRFFFRQICHAAAGPLNLYGFPAQDLYSGESVEETAIRAAAEYKFDAVPQRLITTDLSPDGIHSYVLCPCQDNGYPDEWVVEYRRVGQISVRFMTQDEALAHAWVRGTNKKIIRKLSEPKISSFK